MAVDNIFTGTAVADVGFTPREYHTAHMPDFQVPTDFKHNPPSAKPTAPSTAGFTAPELAEVELWKTTWATPTLAAAIAYAAAYLAYNAELNAWTIANKVARITQWRILVGDGLIYNRATTSQSADNTGAGSDPPPPAVAPRVDP